MVVVDELEKVDQSRVAAEKGMEGTVLTVKQDDFALLMQEVMGLVDVAPVNCLSGPLDCRAAGLF